MSTSFQTYAYVFKYIIVGDSSKRGSRTGRRRQVVLAPLVHRQAVQVDPGAKIGVELGSRTEQVGYRAINLQIWDTVNSDCSSAGGPRVLPL